MRDALELAHGKHAEGRILLAIAGVTALLTACSAPTGQEPTREPTSSPTLTLPADAVFRAHLSQVTGQFSLDLELLVGDAAAGDTQSANTDAKFMLQDVDVELKWLKANPPDGCYSGAFDQWQAVVTATKTALTTWTNGNYTKASKQLTTASDKVSALAKQGINTSCC